MTFQVTMKFDSILEETDGFGRYQIGLVLLLLIPRITIPCHLLLNNFIAAIPSHHCNISSPGSEGIFGNISEDERLTVSIPVQDDGTPSSCHMFSHPQFHLLSNSSSSSEGAVVQCQNGWEYDNSTFISTLATQVRFNEGVSCSSFSALSPPLFLFLSVWFSLWEEGTGQNISHHIFCWRHGWNCVLWSALWQVKHQ